MSDRLPDDLDALFALARATRPDTDSAQYAFETRLLASLRERRTVELPSAWAMVSWRMIPFFAAAVVALTIWQAHLESDASDEAAVTGLTNPAVLLSGEAD